METKLSITIYDKAGTELDFVDADVANGNSFLNDGHTWLVFSNASGSSTVNITVTVVAKVDDDITVPARQASVEAGKVLMLGPFRPELYNDPDGNVALTVSSAIQLCPMSI